MRIEIALPHDYNSEKEGRNSKTLLQKQQSHTNS